jgi:hypothetical protein
MAARTPVGTAGPMGDHDGGGAALGGSARGHLDGDSEINII